MPTAVAHVLTNRSARYLAQLCDHTSRLPAFARHRPGDPRAEHAEDEGAIDFGWARCTLTATPDSLILRGEADTPDLLARLQHGLSTTLERIGRRDGLTVSWSAVQDDTPHRPRRS